MLCAIWQLIIKAANVFLCAKTEEGNCPDVLWMSLWHNGRLKNPLISPQSQLGRTQLEL